MGANRLASFLRKVSARGALSLVVSCALIAAGSIRLLRTAKPEGPSRQQLYYWPTQTFFHWPNPVEDRTANRLETAPVDLRSLAERYPSTLKVESDAPAAVFLGEKRIGTAPGTFTPIAPGLYRVRLDSGEDVILERDVIVTPGSITYVRAQSLARVPRAEARISPSPIEP